ncbi:MAG: TetR/AcrR family transcriptional regulator, partial [Cyclobacteriaceae bacterium]|nr:TetR/AcrR family transcriptional regulator [Cyclobacteriaceae bacterium]
KDQLETIKGEKRQRILQAAVELFARHGYAHTSISQIAQNAGISKGLIYNYFESKETILHELVNDLFQAMYERFGLMGKSELTRDDYVAFINLSIDIVLEDLDRWKLYFSLLTQPNVLKMLRDDLMKQAAPYITLFYEYYKKQGHENPEAWMRYVAAIIDGIQMHILMDPENFPVEEVRKILLKQIL